MDRNVADLNEHRPRRLAAVNGLELFYSPSQGLQYEVSAEGRPVGHFATCAQAMDEVTRRLLA